MASHIKICVAALFLSGSLVPLVMLEATTAAPLTISSTVPQSGANRTIGNGPLPVTGSSGYDFNGQAFSSLQSLDSVAVTLTLRDADSATGQLDFNKLTLGLDGVNTGILLNGFRDNQTDTQTITDVPRDPVTRLPNSATANAVLSALQADGRLVGSIFSTDRPSNNQIDIASNFNTTLSITGVAEGSNWDFTLIEPNRTGVPGSDVVYDGVITNRLGSTLLLNTGALDFDLAAPQSSFTFGLHDAFVDTLGAIPPSGYKGPIFSVQLLQSVPTGMIGMGSIELSAETPATPSSISRTFSLALGPETQVIPEPSAVWLVMTGLLLLSGRIVGRS